MKRFAKFLWLVRCGVRSRLVFAQLASFVSLPAAVRSPVGGMEPKTQEDSEQSYSGGNRQRRKEDAAATYLNVRGNSQRLRLISQRAENLFEFLQLRIRITRTIPKIIFFHVFHLLF